MDSSRTGLVSRPVMSRGLVQHGRVLHHLGSGHWADSETLVFFWVGMPAS